MSQKKSDNRYDQDWNRSRSWKAHPTYAVTWTHLNTKPVQTMMQSGLGDIPSSVCQNKLLKRIWDWKIALFKPKQLHFRSTCGGSDFRIYFSNFKAAFLRSTFTMPLRSDAQNATSSLFLTFSALSCNLSGEAFQWERSSCSASLYRNPLLLWLVLFSQRDRATQDRVCYCLCGCHCCSESK